MRKRPGTDARVHCGRRAPPAATRRDMLARSGAGLGALALGWLLADDGKLAGADGRPLAPLRARGPARSVVLIHHGGGLSHADTFDPKPLLGKLAGKEVPESVARRLPVATRLRRANLYPSPYAFRHRGRSGLEISELFNELSTHADDLCVLRGMCHTSVVHTPADYIMLTGSFTGTRPSLGSWIYYGLGSENSDLPGFVAMVHGDHFSGPPGYSAGFLPARYQGTLVDAGEGVPNVSLPAGFDGRSRRAELDFLGEINAQHVERHGPHSELEARIASYELAFRMQQAAPEAFDLSRESESTRRLYGIDRKECAAFGSQCLLARRLVERGVRFVQLVQGGWDAHGNLKENHDKQARVADGPIAGLLSDLKARGLFETTLVAATTEFGRTPAAEGGGKTPGRDHSPTAYSAWLAGAGIRGGQAIGATDEVGYTVAERPIHPNDLQATILAAMGADQFELYYEHQNRRELVTFNGGEVVEEALQGGAAGKS